MEEYTKARARLLLCAQELTALTTPLAIEAELSASLGWYVWSGLLVRPLTRSICPGTLP
jgi:hypothetical protein